MTHHVGVIYEQFIHYVPGTFVFLSFCMEKEILPPVLFEALK